MIPNDKKRIVLCINYDGKYFFGFQIQPAHRTVQGEMETALHKLYSYKIRIYPSGRTDTGVHALRQYVHFSQSSTSTRVIPPDRVSYALNALLPLDIRVEYSCAVPDNFHARYSAISRIYCYSMYVSHTVPSPWRTVFTSVSSCMRWDSWMYDATQLIGVHDFVAFCKGAQKLHTQGKSTVRTIQNISLMQEGNTMKFFIEANGFLWHMVRAIVGMLMHRASLSYQAYAKLPAVKSILKNCTMCPHNIRCLAPAHGLYLYDVKYNSRYALPYNPIPPSQYVA